MISPNNKFSILTQCKILGISKTSYYYTPKGESEENLKIMKEIDKEHITHPAKGIIPMTDYLRLQNIRVGIKRVRRLMRKMGIDAIFPKKTLSKLGKATYLKSYLLRSLDITHRNQVWCIDITYIPMGKGFLYMTAIIDVFSRFIVGWNLHNSLDASNCIEVLRRAIEEHGTPEFINSDQGGQFTCKDWVDECEKHAEMKISMDGKGRAKDNIWIERFWRTIKYEYIYINPEENGTELFVGIKRFIEDYNYKRTHQGIGRQIPANLYLDKKIPA